MDDLTLSQKLKLKEAILECPSILDEECRKTIKGNLPPYIKKNISTGSTPNIDVDNILTTCQDYHNGLELFIESIDSFDQGKTQMNKVYDTLRDLGIDIGPHGENSSSGKETKASLNLIVTIKHDLNNRNRTDKKSYIFEIDVKLQSFIEIRKFNGVPIYIGTDKKQYTLEELPKWLDLLIVNEFAGGNHVSSNKKKFIDAIEFILPPDLILEEIDQWPLEIECDPGMGMKLGEAYEIHIKVERKVKNQALSKKWEDKYVTFCRDGKCYDENHYFKIYANDGCSYEDYYRKCKARSEVICLVSSYIPKQSSNGNGLGQMIRSAALPVALVYRNMEGNRFDNKKNNFVKDEIETIIKGTPISQLPESILKTRNGTMGNEDHIGNHLTLVWDYPDNDPDIDPHDVHLKS
ncbi:MAG: hypothetical protein HQK89_09085 [Nitrospirae bacterium]|nr:hypothetical protein [Nitrospirota bacterium]